MLPALVGAAGGVMSGIGSLIGMNNQRAAQEASLDLAYRNANDQRMRHADMMEMAQASRGDPLGNMLEYIPGVGWRFNMTPGSLALLKAMESENMQRVTEDAPRARRGRRRNEETYNRASEMGNRALLESEYGEVPSQGELQRLFTQRNLSGQRDVRKQLISTLGKQAMRLGNSSAIGDIVSKATKGWAEPLGDAITNGRLAAIEAYPGVKKAYRDPSHAMQLLQLGTRIDGAPEANSPVYDTMNQMQESSIGKLLATARNGADAVNRANLATADLQSQSYVSPAGGLSAIGDAISGLGIGGGGGGVSPVAAAAAGAGTIDVAGNAMPTRLPMANPMRSQDVSVPWRTGYIPSMDQIYGTGGLF